jgi:hypothetical protein
LSQETKSQETVDASIPQEPIHTVNKQTPATEIIISLKSVADDIGQINELLSEEKLLVAQFFASLLKLMQPLADAIEIAPSTIAAHFKNVAEAYVDPTGHLALTFDDGLFKLLDLAESKNLDLMLDVIPDLLPKFRNLTSAKKSKIEDRMKFLSIVTKEMQRNSDSLSSMYGTEK